MSKVSGGVLGDCSGKIANVVFSHARDFTGKVNTVRSYVVPSNPNTPEQQTRRNLFRASVLRVKAFGPDLYQDDWNRSVGQLPGFQALVRTIIRSVDATPLFTPPAVIPLGNLHLPDTITISTGAGAGEISYTWSTEVGDNGTNGDLIMAFCYNCDPASVHYGEVKINQKHRSEGAAGSKFTGLVSGDSYVVGFYLRGVGTAVGLLSTCPFEEDVAG